MKKIKVRKGQYRIAFNCDYCGIEATDRESHFNRKKRHFCSRKCYSNFRRELLAKEEQHAYKNGGMPEEEKKKRRNTRPDLNHAIRDGKVKRLPCSVCGDPKSEAHHHDYNKPLDVIFFCDKHHHEHESPELLRDINR